LHNGIIPLIGLLLIKRKGEKRSNITSFLEAAKARGRNEGRPGGMSPAALGKSKSAKLLYDSSAKNGEIAKILEISRAT
jgi:hypothetical protein